MNSEKVEFTPPSGFVPPNDNNGEPFDMVCSFSMKGNKLCMTKLGDYEMPGYEKDDETQTKPDYSGYASQMQSQMSGGQQ